MAKKKKQQPTIRERAQKSSGKMPRRLKIKSAGGKLTRPFKRARSVGAKEYHPVKLPDNTAGRVLSTRVRIVPMYFRESWAEIKLVTWPNRSETIRLTLAVFIFAIIFAAIVAFLDTAIDKIFKELIIK